MPADDDIERLLREVEGALGAGSAAGSTPERARPRDSGAKPVPAAGSRPGVVERVRAGVPVAVASGAVTGAATGLLFAVLPFVNSLSGALGGFLGGAAVSLAGRVRRR